MVVVQGWPYGQLILVPWDSSSITERISAEFQKSVWRIASRFLTRSDVYWYTRHIHIKPLHDLIIKLDGLHSLMVVIVQIIDITFTDAEA